MGSNAAALLNGHITPYPYRTPRTSNFLIIGAGARGNAYAQALVRSTPHALIAAVAEPVAFKRLSFGQKYIWGDAKPKPWQSFDDWRHFIVWEEDRRRRLEHEDLVQPGVDGVFVCTLDETHVDVIEGLAPLGLHIMSEKPLATNLQDCLKIYRALQPPGSFTPRAIFSIGHVLHYSPHNILLRKLLLEDEVIGDILSIEHTEPVGWWHFSHSYVRGNWRNESTTAPSLLTKSCHDIDLLLWLLCYPPESAVQKPHLPSEVASTGSLLYFKHSRKPRLAGSATNCYHCPVERECLYSAKRIYQDHQLDKGNAGWPINIIDPEIEDLYRRGQKEEASQRLEWRLREDYDGSDLSANSRPWFGRCVYEANNNVCDDQIVTMSWEDDPLATSRCDTMEDRIKGRGAKNATFHMVASTDKQCERRGHVYGTKGEIEYDSKTIKVHDFNKKQTQTHRPQQPGGGHGGGDAGLAMAFFNAVQAVNLQKMHVAESQRVYIGCTLEEIIRSHAMVFAAEKARKEKKVVNWMEWWQANLGDATRETSD
ncbi:MAG: hypothetical protein Q9217_004586 [Psora testacea]